MITLNKEEIYSIIKRSLKKHYPEFKSCPEINLSLNMKTADYNRVQNRLEFKQHIVSFKYEGDFPRKLTVKEIQKMIREEYLCLEATINLYLDISDKCTNYEEEAIFEAVIDYGKDSRLVEAQMDELINMALIMGDKEWFVELSDKYNQIKIHSKN